MQSPHTSVMTATLKFVQQRVHTVTRQKQNIQVTRYWKRTGSVTWRLMPRLLTTLATMGLTTQNCRIKSIVPHDISLRNTLTPTPSPPTIALMFENAIYILISQVKPSTRTVNARVYNILEYLWKETLTYTSNIVSWMSINKNLCFNCSGIWLYT